MSFIHIQVIFQNEKEYLHNHQKFGDDDRPLTITFIMVIGDVLCKEKNCYENNSLANENGQFSRIKKIDELFVEELNNHLNVMILVQL